MQTPNEIALVLEKRLKAAPRKIARLQRSITRKQPSSKNRLEAIANLEKYVAQTDRSQQGLRVLHYAHGVKSV